MKISILKSDTFKTTKWSGGTTTELYIHPEQAAYQNRDFDFRLSKAIVTDQESVFTPLPKTHRKLMVLEGSITLTHENQPSKQLSEFDVDTFDGDRKTSCAGSCTDFNLMMMGNTSGNLEGFQIQKNQAIERDVPLLPGVANAGDIMRGLDLGLTHFKFFPAVANGGIPALKSLAGPFGQCKFCPTGGITETTAPNWLELDSVLCVGGSWVSG